MTDKEILEKCFYRNEMIEFFNKNVFWMKIDILEDFEEDLIRLCKKKNLPLWQKANLYELECVTRWLLDDIYQFQRDHDNNWERFRKCQ